ncbi:Lipoprotein E precursor [Vibrio aerogenes CECT 7868]|uniref:Lipoprotein E n=1 Tax=Vibrio aerogenes CECT 7868 TaxID=1216006 RepID=A0A1M5ZS02_9VIBR|nr:HAD family acid phosphatase [Vibrio aerogenes]SHI26713.1 Lipoprotein E precursor [Vibrio aerogenes CECT 7868]
MKLNSAAKKYGLCLAAAMLVSGCVNTTVPTKVESPKPNDLLNATLWMQNSVEYKANVRNIFHLAKIQLDHALKNTRRTALPEMQKSGYSKLPPAIILDCDETILDNSPYEAYLIKTGQGYSSTTWKKYVQSQTAKAMPGAVEFTRYAASRGVTVFYVTNRKKVSEQATYENMKALGFPMGNGQTDTLLTKGEQPDWGSAKGNRDALIAKSYRVLLMLGDNFGDFTDKASGDLKQREAAYRENMKHWGTDWFMLPNPAYGSFESSAFGHNYQLSTTQRRQKKIDVLNSWSGK